MRVTSNEWYTLPRYIEAARLVLGDIDLDPASCEIANRTVQARRYYTQEENGLEQAWYGRIWLNPPFGRLSNGTSRIRLFLDRLVQEYRSGNIVAAIAMVKADPKQRWFHPLWNYPICFAHDRVYFLRPNARPEKHQFGTAWAYLGPDETRFTEVFKQFGTIVRSVNRPDVVINESLWAVFSQ